jgi:hypothetical protein
VGCRLRFIDPRGGTLADEPYRPCSHNAIVNMLLCGLGALPHPSAMIRREPLTKIGYYREGFTAAEDIDMWLRLAEQTYLANLEEVLLEYRLHFDSVCSSRSDRQRVSAERAVRETYARHSMPAPVRSVVGIPKTRTASATLRYWSWLALFGGNLQNARKHSRAALARSPYHPAAWLSFTLASLGVRWPVALMGRRRATQLAARYERPCPLPLARANPDFHLAESSTPTCVREN